MVVSALASLLSPWWVSIPPAHLPETFGYESPACWLAVAGLSAILVLDARPAAMALVFVETILVAWFAWATWVVTTPRFTDLPFPFLATDLIGSGWFAAGIALLFVTLWKYEMAAKSARMRLRATRRALLGEDGLRPLGRSAAPS